MFTLCGNFAKNNPNIVNGQVTKTRNIYSLLKKGFSVPIKTIDTSRGRIKTFVSLFFSFFKSEVFFLCVSRNGTKRIVPLLHFLHFFRKKTKLIYFCVGTCPFPQNYKPGLLLTKKQLKVGQSLSFFDYVCPETMIMKQELEKVFKINNIQVFKNYQINKQPIHIVGQPSFNRFVFFSRISSEKNIKCLFKSLDELKNKHNEKICLDFYGPVDPKILDFFQAEINKREECAYRGIVESECSPSILKDYKALIFTTNCLEGTPGAIIDAVFAGVPIISQPFWASDELISQTGVGLVNVSIVDNIVKFLSLNIESIDELRKNCASMAASYGEESAIENLKLLIQN